MRATKRHRPPAARRPRRKRKSRSQQWLSTQPPRKRPTRSNSLRRGQKSPFQTERQIDRKERLVAGRQAKLFDRFKTSPTARERMVIQGQSGRQDLNLRPLDPQSSALARLRHAPKYSQHREGSRLHGPRPPHYCRTSPALQHELTSPLLRLSIPSMQRLQLVAERVPL